MSQKSQIRMNPIHFNYKEFICWRMISQKILDKANLSFLFPMMYLDK